MSYFGIIGPAAHPSWTMETVDAAAICDERAEWYRTAGCMPGDHIRADEAKRCATAIREARA
jgi:hypothetical protein